MIAVLQRVSSASLHIDKSLKCSIKSGLVILLGIAVDDTEDDINWIVNKCIQLRIFGDENGKMNFCVKEINGEILLVSQFTLLSNSKKGNRPSFIEAAPPPIAIPLYQKSIHQFAMELGKPIQTGTFGADMQVSLINDGPVTIHLDSKNRK